MANLVDNPTYAPNIFKLELTTPVRGGDPVFSGDNPIDGFSNAQAQQLANRTAYLKEEVESLEASKENTLTAGTGITIDRTDPSNPIISSTGGGGGAVTSVDGQTGVVDLSGTYTPLSHVGSRGTGVHTNATTTESGFMSSSDKSKLNGVESNATANQTDAYLLDRTNHTGTQAIDTVIGLQAVLDDKEYILTAGTNVVIDRTDPLNPIINATLSGGGGGDVVGPASSVNNEVALFDGVTGKLIKGGGTLGDAAFTSAASYATSAQGGLADTAVQPGDLATVATTGAYSDLSGTPPLGTISAQDANNVTITGGTLRGTAINVGNMTEGVEALSGTTPAISPTTGSIKTWTLSGNSTPTAGTWAEGQAVTLMIDDGTAYTINWSSLAVKWKTNTGSAPTLNTTGFTAITLWKVGSTIYGARVGDA